MRKTIFVFLLAIGCPVGMGILLADDPFVRGDYIGDSDVSIDDSVARGITESCVSA